MPSRPSTGPATGEDLATGHRQAPEHGPDGLQAGGYQQRRPNLQQEAIDAANVIAGGFFFKADKNGDGVLSPDEARRAPRSTSARNRGSAMSSTAPSLQEPRQPVAGQPTATVANQNPVATFMASFNTNNDKQLQATEHPPGRPDRGTGGFRHGRHQP